MAAALAALRGLRASAQLGGAVARRAAMQPPRPVFRAVPLRPFASAPEAGTAIDGAEADAAAVPADGKGASVAGANAAVAEADAAAAGADTAAAGADATSTGEGESASGGTEEGGAPGGGASGASAGADAAADAGADAMSTGEGESASGGASGEGGTKDARPLGGRPPPPEAPPMSWRRAGEWVDLEFERANLSSEGGEASSWGTEEFPQPEVGVLFPHPALQEHRSRPFGGPLEGEPVSDDQIKANRKRIEALWRMSASHGVSWDELDEAYLSFSKAGTKTYRRWAGAPFADEAARQDPRHEPPCVLAKRLCNERASAYMSRFCEKGEDPMVRFPTRTKRLAGKLYTQEKKRVVGPWRPGRLTSHLQQLVAAKMMRRETQERALGLTERQK